MLGLEPCGAFLLEQHRSIPFGAAAFGDVAEDEHRADNGAGGGPDWRRAVINGDFPAITCDQDSVIREARDQTVP